MMRRKTPAPVRDAAAGQKVLAWTKVAGDWLVATPSMLVLPGRGPLAWIDIVRAAWDEPVLELQLAEGMYRLVLEQPGRIPHVVNERVKASVVMQEHVELVAGKGVRLIARREPGGADVTWRVVFDSGLDPANPELRAAADQALAELRVATGL